MGPIRLRYAVAKLQRLELANSDRHAIGDAFEVFVLPFADDPELVPALEVVEPEPIEP
jgi:hypothetical protein